MTNLYDLERMVSERKREIDEYVGHEARLAQLGGDEPISRGVSDGALRVRFGLLLIRLGARLAA